MKLLLLFSALLAGIASNQCTAQSKDCDIVKMKMSDGTTSNMIRANGAIGYFMIGKYEGKTTLFYNTKGFFAQRPVDAAVLRIDSVKFVFTDNSSVALKLYSGIGTLDNLKAGLQPHITKAQFSVVLLPNSEADKKLRTAKVRAFTVVAQKEAQYGDVFNEKQQDKLMQSFSCLP